MSNELPVELKSICGQEKKFSIQSDFDCSESCSEQSNKVNKDSKVLGGGALSMFSLEVAWPCRPGGTLPPGTAPTLPRVERQSLGERPFSVTPTSSMRPTSTSPPRRLGPWTPTSGCCCRWAPRPSFRQASSTLAPPRSPRAWMWGSSSPSRTTSLPSSPPLTHTLLAHSR